MYYLKSKYQFLSFHHYGQVDRSPCGITTNLYNPTLISKVNLTWNYTPISKRSKRAFRYSPTGILPCTLVCYTSFIKTYRVAIPISDGTTVHGLRSWWLIQHSHVKFASSSKTVSIVRPNLVVTTSGNINRLECYSK